jgi:hypothetical protein
MSQQVYLVRPAIFVPVTLLVTAVIIASHATWWFLTAVPFIWLGSICAQPNLNLVNGCLAYVAMIVGGILWACYEPLGQAVFCGAVAGYYLSAIEKLVRIRAVSLDDLSG